MRTTNLAGNAHLRREVLVCGISNAVFNGLCAWLLIRNGPDLSWGGSHSFVVDVLATGLLLPLIVALIVIPLQRGKLRKGSLESINLGADSLWQALADRFPGGVVKCALLFGLIGLLLFAPLTLAGFHLLGVQAVSPLGYSVFKGVWAGLIAAVLVVPMVLIALRDPHPAR